ncbi:Ig-like domain-containing protein [Pontiella sp.]|uniref:Ig-like domain-containing protein n=1 Tax=Pontiella sp. TaxID=2837462 RepID=UPI003561C35A
MSKRWLGVMTALAGMTLAGTVQAVVVATNLNITASSGNYPNGTVITTAQSFNGATFDINYTLGSIANGSNSFIGGTATLMGVGSDADISAHYTTLEGDDGEGMSFTSLSISNFVANGSGLEIGDIAELKFTGVSVGAAGNSQDGVAISFSSFTNGAVNFDLNNVTANYTVDLTVLSNYPVLPDLATMLFIKPDNAGSSNRWNVDGVEVSYVVNTGVNEAPSADAQSITTFPDTAVDITLTGSDPELSNLTYNVESLPIHGDLVGGTNMWTYTPDSGFVGVDSFTFSVSDGELGSAAATVTINVTNQMPVAIAQSVDVYRYGSVNITLSGSDPDSGPSNLTYAVFSPPANGSLATNGSLPNLTYTLENNAAESDSFTFSVHDGLATSDPVTVTINVLNNPPVADSKLAFTEPDTPVAIVLSGSDVEAGSLTYSVVTQPANGSLSGTEPNLTYTPTSGFAGTDSFTYTVNDGENDSAEATVTISVSAEGFILSCVDLNASTIANTLTVGGLSAEVTGVATNNDYVISVAFDGTDLDGDAINDEVTFDVRVKAWTGGTMDLGIEGAGSTTNASATIGTNNVATSIAGTRFCASGTIMPAGSSLEFLVENLSVSLSDPTKVGSAVFSGFASARLEQTAGTGNSHQVIFGEGTGLLGWDFDTNQESGPLNVGTGALYISSDDAEGDNVRESNWGVENVDFGIVVYVGQADIPGVAIGVSGSDLVFTWEGGGTYDLMTNANLAYPKWGVAEQDAASPVTIAIGSESQLFFKLSE